MERYQERSREFRCLMGLCVVMAIAIIVSVVANIVIVQHSIHVPPEKNTLRKRDVKTPTPIPLASKWSNFEVCQTDHCIKTAALIKSNIDQSVNPCDDFEAFACGKWVENTVVPDDQYDVAALTIAADIVENRTKELLESASEKLDAVKKSKILYRSCMDTDSIERKGVKEVLKIFHDRKLAFPLIPEFNFSSDLESEIIKYSQNGLPSFVDLGVKDDLHSPAKKILTFYVHMLTTYKSEFTYNSTGRMSLLRSYITNLTNALIEPDEADSQDIDDIIEYEKSVARLWHNSRKLPFRENIHRRVTLRELKSALLANGANVDIEKVIKAVFASPSIDEVFNSEDILLVWNLNKCMEYAKLLAQSKPRTLLNVLGLATVKKYLSFMPEKLRSIGDSFTLQYHATKPPRRWKKCMDENMVYAKTRMYADKHFPRAAKDTLTQLTFVIKAQLQLHLSLNTWMDLNTRTRGLEKANAMTLHIAYPDWILDDRLLNAFYERMSFNQTEALQNAIEFHLESRANLYKTLFNRTFDIWPISPMANHAVYFKHANKFAIYTGVLQPPYYDTQYLKSLNYGAIGFEIGHEMIHGFNEDGRYYDKVGAHVDWWSQESQELYEKKKRCIIDRYSRYKYDSINMTVNSEQTQSEDTTDNEAVQLSFAIFCEKTRVKYVPHSVETGGHSPQKIRVIGMMGGIKGFTDAFKCPVGSRMNPGTKCQM